jgi:hypothetical protein
MMAGVVGPQMRVVAGPATGVAVGPGMALLQGGSCTATSQRGERRTVRM